MGTIRTQNAIFGLLLVNWLVILKENLKYIFNSKSNIFPLNSIDSANSTILILSSTIFGLYLFYLGCHKLKVTASYNFRKKIPIFTLFILFFSVFIPIINAYIFQEENQGIAMMIINEVLLNQDFEDVPPGEVPPGWESLDGNWTTFIDDGNVVYVQDDYSDKEALSITMTGNSSWSNYTFEIDLKFVSGNEKKTDRGALLIFRYQGGNDYYFLWLKEYQDEMELYNHGAEGGGGAVGITQITLVDGIWYHVNVTIIGQEVYVSVDDVSYFEGVDMAGSNNEGNVGVGTRYYQVMFDNIYVYPI